jgi:hypothetical protein
MTRGVSDGGPITAGRFYGVGCDGSGVTGGAGELEVGAARSEGCIVRKTDAVPDRARRRAPNRLEALEPIVGLALLNLLEVVDHSNSTTTRKLQIMRALRRKNTIYFHVPSGTGRYVERLLDVHVVGLGE